MSPPHPTPDDVGGGAIGGRADLTEICNVSVALHREHFGRGPGAAKAYATDDLVACLVTDVLTRAELTLISVGEGNRVLETRVVHQAAVRETYRLRMESVLGRPVKSYISALEIGAGSILDCYLLEVWVTRTPLNLVRILDETIGCTRVWVGGLREFDAGACLDLASLCSAHRGSIGARTQSRSGIVIRTSVPPCSWSRIS